MVSRAAAATARKQTEELRTVRRECRNKVEEATQAVHESESKISGLTAELAEVEGDLAATDKEKRRLEAEVDLLHFQLEELATWREKWLEWMKADIALNTGRRALAYDQPEEAQGD